MVVTTRAVLLRSHRYGETSRILRFHARDHGVVGVVAKGWSASGGRGRGANTFAGGDLIFYMKEGRDLHTLKDFAVSRQRRGIGRHPLRLGGASVVAEVVLRNVGQGAHPRVHDVLEEGLDLLEAVEPADLIGAVVSLGWRLVAELGYAPVLDACVRCGTALGDDEIGRFDFPEGGIACARCSVDGAGPRLGGGARAQLTDLVGGSWVDDLRKPRAHVRLLSDFITYHMGDARPLESVSFLLRLIDDDGDA